MREKVGGPEVEEQSLVVALSRQEMMSGVGRTFI